MQGRQSCGMQGRQLLIPGMSSRGDTYRIKTMDYKNKKLGILLFNGPESEDTQTVIGLSYAAIKAAIGVEIFLMYEGALNASYGAFTALCDKGVKVTVCNYNADELKAYKHDKFKYGSQYDNAYIGNETDRYISFI